MKTVYAWVADWGKECTPRISIDLFFSSEEKFIELTPLVTHKEEQLVPIQVPDDFDYIDFIPDNY